MSRENKSLLDKHRTELMESIDLAGSSLLDELLQRGALQPQQVQVIKVNSHRYRYERLGLSLSQFSLQMSIKNFAEWLRMDMQSVKRPKTKNLAQSGMCYALFS